MFQKFNLIYKISFVIFSFMLLSCGGEDDGGDGNGNNNGATSLTVSASSTTTFIGNEVDFYSVASYASQPDQIVTSQSTFYVNGSAISGSNHTFNQAGNYSVKASLGNLDSNTITITVNEAPTAYVHRLLIEDFTGTWCGWCPRASKGIEDLKDQGVSITPVAAHNNDSFESQASIDLHNLFNITGWPTVKYNRGPNWSSSSSNSMNLNQIINAIDTSGKSIGISIASSNSGNNITATVNVSFLSAETNTKLLVYLLEDGPTANQSNYTSNYDGLDPIPNFVHNDILRACATSIQGDAISNSDSEAGDIYTTTINYNLTNAANLNNVRVVAVVLDSNGLALNAQEVDLGATKDFEGI